jgi:hypothetical protein
VDVGGGHGALLATIAEKFPNIRGIVAERPEVAAGTKTYLASRKLNSRIEAAAVDFFETIPAGADAYIMKHIIHDWDDARSSRILENCRKAMAPGGRVLIVDQVVSDRPEAALSKIADLEMLVMTSGGRERTEQEFDQLLRGAGLKMTRVVPTMSVVCVVEGVAA